MQDLISHLIVLFAGAITYRNQLPSPFLSLFITKYKLKVSYHVIMCTY